MKTIEINLLDSLEAVIRRKRGILAFALLVAIITAIVSLIVPKKYESRAVLMPPSSSAASMLNKVAKNIPLGKLGGAGLLGGSGQNDLTNVYLAILSSRTLRSEMIRKFNLVHVYKFDKAKKYYVEDVLKEVNRHVSSDISDEGTILIFTEDEDPVRAADMANFMANYLNEVYKTLTTQKDKSYRLFVEGRVNIAKKDLQKAEADLLEFQKKNRMVDIEEQSKASIEAGSQLEAQYRLAELNLDIYRKMYTEDNPKIREQLTGLRSLEKQKNQLSTDRTSDLLIPYRQAPDIAIEYLRLKREFKIQEALTDFLIQQYEEAKFEESKNTPYVQVLDPGVPAQRRSFPHRSKMVLIAFFSSVLAGSFLTLFMDYLEKFKRKNPEESAKIFRILRQTWRGWKKP